MKLIIVANTAIINIDQTNASVAALNIITMRTVNTLARVDRTAVGIIGISACDQITTTALGR